MCTGQQWPGVVKRLMSSSHSRLTLGFNRKGGRSGPTGLVGRRRLVAAGRRLTYALGALGSAGMPARQGAPVDCIAIQRHTDTLG